MSCNYYIHGIWLYPQLKFGRKCQMSCTEEIRSTLCVSCTYPTHVLQKEIQHLIYCRSQGVRIYRPHCSCGNHCLRLSCNSKCIVNIVSIVHICMHFNSQTFVTRHVKIGHICTQNF